MGPQHPPTTRAAGSAEAMRYGKPAPDHEPKSPPPATKGPSRAFGRHSKSVKGPSHPLDLPDDDRSSTPFHYLTTQAASDSQASTPTKLFQARAPGPFGCPSTPFHHIAATVNGHVSLGGIASSSNCIASNSYDHLSGSLCMAQQLPSSLTKSPGITHSKWKFTLNLASTAVLLVKEVAEAFENVPYIQAVAGVVIKIIEIADQIQNTEERCRELIDKVRAHSRIIFEPLRGIKLEQFPTLEDDLLEIACVLQSIYTELQHISRPPRLTRILNRGDILRRIEEQDRRLDACMARFQAKSLIHLRTHSSPGAELPTLYQAPPRPHRLRSKPQIMYGRDAEINRIVEEFLQQADTGASIAILGPGGIGKTSIALSVMHDDRICSKYEGNRIFISCEAVTSVDLIVSDLALALQISLEGTREPISTISAQLRKAPHLIIFDNFETPWDLVHVRPEVEGLLANITAIKTTSVLITARGSQYPAGVKWTQIPPVRPVDLDSAMSIFRDISNKMDDFAIKLLKAVDCFPLAITLLANLAAVDGETPEALWHRWEEESTGMLGDGPKGRLSNLEYSVWLSLSSPRMKDNPEALALLSLLSLLPDGMYPGTFVKCGALPGVGNISKAKSTLLQNALVVIDSSNESLRVLSPIRLFICARHPPTPEAKAFLQSYYIDLALQGSTPDSVVRGRLTQEVGNIEAMLIDALRSGIPIERVIEATLNFTRHTYISGVGSTSTIAFATGTLSDLLSKDPTVSPFPGGSTPLRWWAERLTIFGRMIKNPTQTIPRIPVDIVKMLADCLGCWGQLLSRQFQFQQAELKYAHAIRLHMQAGDLSGHANDLHNLACLYMRQPGSLGNAKETFLAAMALHDQIHDRTGKAHDLMAVGQLHLQNLETKAAEDRLLEALSLYDEIGDSLGQASALNALGHLSIAQSNCDNAERHYTKALNLNIAGGNTVGQSEGLAGLARVSLIQSRFCEARVRIDNAMSLHSPTHYADHLVIFGRVLIAERKHEEACRILNHAAELHAAAGDRLGGADDALYLAFVYLQQPNSFDKAFEMALTSLEAYRALDNISGQGSALATLAMMDIRRGLYDQALKKLDTAVVFHRQVNNLLGEALDYHYIGYAQLQNVQYERALESLNIALGLHVETGNVQGQADNKVKIAEVLLRCGDIDAALIAVNQALVLHTQINYSSGQGDALYVQGCIFLEDSQLSESEKSLRQAYELHKGSGLAFPQGLDLAALSSALLKQFMKNPTWGRIPRDELEALEPLWCLNRAIELLQSTAGDGHVLHCKRRQDEARRALRLLVPIVSNDLSPNPQLGDSGPHRD